MNNMEQIPAQELGPEEYTAYKARIIDNIRNVFDAGHISFPVRSKTIPEPRFEYKNLIGKKIMMVDDAEANIAAVLPEIAVATDGHASAVYHMGESPEETAAKIMEGNPAIVLMDYTLAAGKTGVDVINALKAAQFEGTIIGFSDSPENNDKLAAAIDPTTGKAILKKNDGNMLAVAQILTQSPE